MPLPLLRADESQWRSKTEVSGGLCRPPFFVARRSQTMYPVYLDRQDLAHGGPGPCLAATSRICDIGGGYRSSDEFSRSVISRYLSGSVTLQERTSWTMGALAGSGTSLLFVRPSARRAGTRCGIFSAARPKQQKRPSRFFATVAEGDDAKGREARHNGIACDPVRTNAIMETMAASKRLRGRWVLAIAVAVVGAGAVVVTRSDPSLAEQAAELHDVEPLAPEGLTLTAWARDGLVLRADFTGEGVRGGFELRLWPREADAEKWFRVRLGQLTGNDVSDSDDVAGREPCEREGLQTTCAGFDGFRTFEAWVTTSAEAAGEVDPRFLIRTARKHWYGVMGGHFELGLADAA